MVGSPGGDHQRTRHTARCDPYGRQPQRRHPAHAADQHHLTHQWPGRAPTMQTGLTPRRPQVRPQHLPRPGPRAPHRAGHRPPRHQGWVPTARSSSAVSPGSTASNAFASGGNDEQTSMKPFSNSPTASSSPADQLITLAIASNQSQRERESYKCCQYRQLNIRKRTLP